MENMTARQEFRELLQLRFGSKSFTDDDALAVLQSKQGLKERVLLEAIDLDGPEAHEFDSLFMRMDIVGIKLDPIETEKFFFEPMPSEDEIAELIGPVLMMARWPEIIEEI